MDAIRPLRSPYEQIAGLLLLARAVDAIRAELPYPRELVELLGLPEDAFVDAVRCAPDDEAVAEWITAHCNTTTFEAINRRLIDAGLIEREAVAG